MTWARAWAFSKASALLGAGAFANDTWQLLRKESFQRN
jgi:hypothetical protein